jgi:nicotinamidase-related amidase
MTERIWDKFLTERDRQVFAAAGYATPQGFGARPALLVVDVNYFFCGDRPQPILESIKRWRNSCGEDAWPGVAVIKRLVLAARERGVPVIYTTGNPRPDQWNRGSWRWKNSRAVEDGTRRPENLDGNTIVPDIAPAPQDIVVRKEKPSGFFGTPLLSYLVLLNCDSVIVTGTTTSGCVRASVLDAFSNNYRVTVVEDGCFDRSQASHAVSLCDMHAKYADVRPSSEALEFLAQYPAGQFELPAGALPEARRKAEGETRKLNSVTK